MIDFDSLTDDVVGLAVRGKRVLLVVPDKMPIGSAFKGISESIKRMGVHGFKFLEGKRLIEHGSGGRIFISCEHLIVRDDVLGQEFNEVVGSMFLTATAQQIVAGRIRHAR